MRCLNKSLSTRYIHWCVNLVKNCINSRAMEHKVNCIVPKRRHFRNSGRALNDRQGSNKLELHSNINILQHYTCNVTAIFSTYLTSHPFSRLWLQVLFNIKWKSRTLSGVSLAVTSDRFFVDCGPHSSICWLQEILLL